MQLKAVYLDALLYIISNNQISALDQSYIYQVL